MAGIVEGVEHELDSLEPVGHIDLGIADVVADGEADSDAVDRLDDEAVAGAVDPLVAGRAHALVVAIDNPAFGIDQVEAVYGGDELIMGILQESYFICS